MGSKTHQDCFRSHFCVVFFYIIFEHRFERVFGGFGMPWRWFSGCSAGAKVVIPFGTSFKNQLFTRCASRSSFKAVLEGFFIDFGSVLGGKMEPCWPPRRSQEAPGGCPGGFVIKREAAKTPQEASRRLQEASRRLQDRFLLDF